MNIIKTKENQSLVEIIGIKPSLSLPNNNQNTTYVNFFLF